MREDFQNAIYQDTRRTAAEIVYQLTAPDSKEGGGMEFPDESELSRSWQMMNEERNQPAPVGTLEPEYWSLEGRFMIAPEAGADDGLEIGYWSAAMSDEAGYFAAPQVIRRDFAFAQSFNALTITFDIESQNFAMDFDTEFYDGFDNLVYFEQARGNDSPVYATSAAGVNIAYCIMRFFRTNNPYRFLRIIEIDFGITLRFTGDEIFSVDLVREGNYSGQGFIYPELRISIANRGGYNLLDSNSYANYFLQRQRFTYRHGLVMPNGMIDWIDCGTYFLHDWRVSDERVEFTARGRTARLSAGIYRDSTFNLFDIQQLARKIFAQTDIDQLNLAPQIPGFFGNINHRQAMAMLIEFTSCLTFETRDNRIRFVDIIRDDAFVLNTLPPHQRKIYRWIDDNSWDDNLNWIDNGG